jgi:hypothetical protein
MAKVIDIVPSLCPLNGLHQTKHSAREHDNYAGRKV